jgi:hypothetical protein
MFRRYLYRREKAASIRQAVLRVRRTILPHTPALPLPQRIRGHRSAPTMQNTRVSLDALGAHEHALGRGRIGVRRCAIYRWYTSVAPPTPTVSVRPESAMLYESPPCAGVTVTLVPVRT